MPASASRPASAASTSWLLADPTTARQRSRPTVDGPMMPPSAQGAKTSQACSNADEGSTTSTGELARTEATVAWSTSDTRTTAPASTSCRTSGRPTFPSPSTTIRRPARSPGPAPPSRWPRVARIATTTPAAVSALGSPAPPPSSRSSHDVGRLRADEVHVGGRRADVLGGDVAPVELLHQPPEREHHRLGPVERRIADDDRLAAAEVEAGERGLGGHRPPEPDRVVDRVDHRRRTGGSGSHRAPGRAPWTGSTPPRAARTIGRALRRAPRGRRRPARGERGAPPPGTSTDRGNGTWVFAVVMVHLRTSLS